MEKNFNEKTEQFIELMRLPKDVVLGASIITMIGKSDVFIENYKGIIEYTEEKIVVQGKKEKIFITGKRLKISYYSKEELKISGNVMGVNY